ncbi:MAG: copper chaperone CopZ [Crocinitomicaceae bacterium]|jgi:copper chaperone CopZ
MRKLFFGFALLTLFASCSTSESEIIKPAKAEVASTDESSTQVAALVIPNRLLTVEVDGMVCEMGCGGTIRKGLKGADGVANCSFDYEEGRAVNTATIEFDKELISADKISTLIASLNDGQFTIGESSTSGLEQLKENSVESSKVDKTKEVIVEKPAPINMSSSSTGFEMPNILDLFSGLLTR